MPLPAHDKAAIADDTAELLLEVEAVFVRPEKPFMFTSGWASPVSTDMRKVISYPRSRSRLLDHAVTVVKRESGYEALDVVAGGETAGIPFATRIAEHSNDPGDARSPTDPMIGGCASQANLQRLIEVFRSNSSRFASGMETTSNSLSGSG